MHTSEETREQLASHPCKHFDALLADIFKSPDNKPPQRRRNDNNDNNGHNNLGDHKTIALLIIMTILIAAVTAVLAASFYCDLAGFDDTSYLIKTAILQNKS